MQSHYTRDELFVKSLVLSQASLNAVELMRGFNMAVRVICIPPDLRYNLDESFVRGRNGFDGEDQVSYGKPRRSDLVNN
jgi:hypothetical protein